MWSDLFPTNVRPTSADWNFAKLHSVTSTWFTKRLKRIWISVIKLAARRERSLGRLAGGERRVG